MEIWDVYDRYRCKTGRIHERGTLMKEGDYHIVVHIWIVNDKGEVLIQKRQPWKVGWPNMWDCAAAGSAIKGDDSISAAIRETKEEIGIDLDISSAEHLFTVKFSCGFDDIWLVRQNINISDLKLQYEEVADAKWVRFEDIEEMIRKKEFIDYDYFGKLIQLISSNISLIKAKKYEAEELLAIQKKVFMPIYKKYQDHEISPVMQTLDKFLKRFDIGDFYKIFYDGNLVGSVFVYEKKPGLMRFHIINILEEYQNLGIAQRVMERLELMYPQEDEWELDTIKAEKRNCHLYEKMGYVKLGEEKKINDKLTIISYRKNSNISRIKSI